MKSKNKKAKIKCQCVYMCVHVCIPKPQRCRKPNKQTNKQIAGRSDPAGELNDWAANELQSGALWNWVYGK